MVTKRVPAQHFLQDYVCPAKTQISLHRLISLCCQPQDALDPWLPKSALWTFWSDCTDVPPVKTLINSSGLWSDCTDVPPVKTDQTARMCLQWRIWSDCTDVPPVKTKIRLHGCASSEDSDQTAWMRLQWRIWSNCMNVPPVKNLIRLHGCASSEDSDQTAWICLQWRRRSLQSDLSLHWRQMLSCRKCCAQKRVLMLGRKFNMPVLMTVGHMVNQPWS